MQAATAELAFGEFEFAGHARHVEASVAPTDIEYVPVKQFVHAALPLMVLYFPATHEVHRPPSEPVKPALQTQAATAELVFGEFEFAGHARHVEASVAPTAMEYVPAKQSVHATLPLIVLYFPATQEVHRPPSGPVKPALQTQALTAELAVGELEFAGHVRHVVAIVAPAAVEYVPAPQSAHAALPLAILYFPATHAAHGPPSGPVKPMLQAQALTAALPLGEVVPAGHETHTFDDCVVNLLYLIITMPEPPLPPLIPTGAAL